MSKSYWSNRWISRREINDRKKWASAWKSNPERMKLAQANATKAAQLSKARSKDNLLLAVQSFIPTQPMNGAKLKRTLMEFLKAHKKPYTKKGIKALTVRLTRYGALTYCPDSGLWILNT
jgi:hypothetical protein